MDTAKDATQGGSSLSKKLRRIGVGLVVLLAAGCVVFFALQPREEEYSHIESSPIGASAIYRTTVSESKSLVIYEGLPHQMFDSELLATEIKREDTTEIWDFPFYTPSVAATNAEELRKLLSKPTSLAVYGGPSFCGGYHPDFCISWQAGEVKYYALICFGCHELVFYDGRTSLKYGVEAEAIEGFKQLLARYEAKRPKSTR